MGADLIVAWCDVVPDLATYIASVSDEEIKGAYLEAIQLDDDDDYDPAAIRAYLVNLLYDRDLVELVVHGHAIWVGGGTSYGDSFAAIDMISTLSILIDMHPPQ